MKKALQRKDQTPLIKINRARQQNFHRYSSISIDFSKVGKHIEKLVPQMMLVVEG